MIDETDTDLINFLLNYEVNVNNLPASTNISLLNPSAVSTISNVLVKIISYGLETEKNVFDKITLDQTFQTIQSWCQINFNNTHRILNKSSLKVLCNYLTESLNCNDLDNYEFRHSYRLCIQNSVKKGHNWEEEVDLVYNKKLKKKELIERRKSFNLVDYESQSYNYRKISDTRKRTNADYAHFALAVKNLKENTNFQDIYKQLILYLSIYCRDLNQIKDLEEKGNIDFQIFVLESQTELLELEILNMIETVIDKISLSSNYDEKLLKNSIYDVVKSTSFFNQALTYYYRSKILFSSCIEIFNHIFIKSRFDLRILFVIDLFLNIVRNQLKQKSITELYPFKYKELVFLMELFSNSFCSKLVSKNDLLERLNHFDLKSRTDCILLLSHYPKLVNFYKIFISQNAKFRIEKLFNFNF